jgi:hypothetical protein
MAKDKDKKPGKGSEKAAAKIAAKGATATSTEPTAGDHHVAGAHGRPVKVDTSLPASRPELLALHAAARARRNGAALGSPEFRAAVLDLERIEVRIAAIDRAADPPLG